VQTLQPPAEEADREHLEDSKKEKRGLPFARDKCS
jgi:hypothetical protein